MKTIPLKEAAELLEKSSAVIIDDDLLVYPIHSSVINDPDNDFLTVIDDSTGDQQMFVEQDNQTVEVVGNSMFLINNDGNRAQITILVPLNLEP